MVTLFFFLPFIAPATPPLGIVAVAATMAVVVRWETESVGGDEEEDAEWSSMLSTPLPLILVGLPCMLFCCWLGLMLSILGGMIAGPQAIVFRLLAL